ncbi:acetate--CoA ligase family protein [Rhodovibrionaceae bacterium A322]
MSETGLSKLKQFLSPRSVAIIGASDNPTRIGGRPVHYLKNHGYEGEIYPVNPQRETVQGLKAYTDVDSIDGPVDAAIVAVPAARVMDAVQACADKGVKGCIVLSSGFAELSEAGGKAQDDLTSLARESGMRIFGPNCLGSVNVHERFFATFSGVIARQEPLMGGLSLVTQSGAFGSHLYGLAQDAGLGLRYMMTTGNECDVQVADGIQVCAEDPKTSVIIAYAEGIKDGPRLIAALEAAAAAEKPVIFFKVGRSAVGAEAARAHTASDTGDDMLADAILRQYGAYRAETTEELMDIAYAATHGSRPKGKRLGLITVSGGVGVLMSDAAEAKGLDVAPLAEEAQAALVDLMPFAAARNPVDVTAQILNQLDVMPQFFSTLLEKGQYDASIVFFSSAVSTKNFADTCLAAMKELRREHPDAYIIMSILADETQRRDYEALGFPVFADPSRAVSAIGALARFSEAFERQKRRGELEDAVGQYRADIKAGLTQKTLLSHAGLDLGPDLSHGSSKDAAETTLEVQLDLQDDPTFGPVMTVKPAGSLGRALNSRACRRVPFSSDEAEDLLGELKLGPLFEQQGGYPAADKAALVAVLSRLSLLAAAGGLTPGEADQLHLIVRESGKGVAVKPWPVAGNGRETAGSTVAQPAL